MKGFEAALPQFEALGAQVVGISTDHHLALAAWQKDQGSKQLFLSDFRRQMLPAYGAMQTDEKSPVYRYAKRAYFIIDKTGTVKFVKVMDNPLDLLDAEEVLKATKAASCFAAEASGGELVTLPAGARRLEGSRQRGRPCADPSSISRSPRTLRASGANRPPTATPPGKGV